MPQGLYTFWQVTLSSGSFICHGNIFCYHDCCFCIVRQWGHFVAIATVHVIMNILIAMTTVLPWLLFLCHCRHIIWYGNCFVVMVKHFINHDDGHCLAIVTVFCHGYHFVTIVTCFMLSWLLYTLSVCGRVYLLQCRELGRICMTWCSKLLSTIVFHVQIVYLCTECVRLDRDVMEESHIYI